MRIASANATSAMPPATGASSSTCSKVTFGTSTDGRPDGMSPTTATPRSARFITSDSTMDATVSTSTVGNRGHHFPPTMSRTSVTAAIPNVVQARSPAASTAEADELLQGGVALDLGAGELVELARQQRQAETGHETEQHR